MRRVSALQPVRLLLCECFKHILVNVALELALNHTPLTSPMTVD